MKFESRLFPEPDLEFGDKHRHPDPRLGLAEAGPLQSPLGDAIKIAVVGSSKTIDDSRRFLNDAVAGFAAEVTQHPNLHPDFPGLGNRNPFRCKFEVVEGATSAVPQALWLEFNKSEITIGLWRWLSMRSCNIYTR